MVEELFGHSLTFLALASPAWRWINAAMIVPVIVSDPLVEIGFRRISFL